MAHRHIFWFCRRSTLRMFTADREEAEWTETNSGKPSARSPQALYLARPTTPQAMWPPAGHLAYLGTHSLLPLSDTAAPHQ